MGACLSAKREISSPGEFDSREIFHNTMARNRHNSVFENYYENQVETSNTGSGLQKVTTTHVWDDVNCYDEATMSNMHNILRTQMTWEVADDTQPSAEYIVVPPSRTATLENELQSTFSLDSPVEEGEETKLEQFDEPTMTKASSPFDDYVSERKIKEKDSTFVNTASGRWAVLVGDHIGLDGFGNHVLLKPCDGTKPFMRSHSSFEVRTYSSFMATTV